MAPDNAAHEWVATYRLQVHAGFSLSDAQQTLPYLASLGVSHVYLAPCLQSVPGSGHGYDVTDPTKVSDDLGGEHAWAAFVQAAHARGLKLLLDIVPNHMSASRFNPWWDDVLANGPQSEYAKYFDIRIAPGEAFCVHLCSLARRYGAAMEAGELKLDIAGGRPRIKHYDNSWPLNPASLSVLEISEADGGLAAAVKRANEDPDLLDKLLQRQFYRLHDWKLAGELTNFRRFFDVSGLVGVRNELPQVMDATHARIERMIAHGDLDGLRADHPDGLREPLAYFTRLRALLPQGRIYIEKILDNDERLVEGWPIEGTVGYEFLAKVNRLWMDDQRTDVLTATYQDFTGHSVNLNKLIRETKNSIIESTFAIDLQELSDEAAAIAASDWRTRDLSPRQLHEAIARLIVAMPVYRTYRTQRALRDEDKRILTDAIQSSRLGAPGIDAAVFDFLAELLCKPRLNDAEWDFVARWQQLTPPVTAKGVEDTAFYSFDRLISCNEVGSQASLVGISSDRFHEFCHYLSERWPKNLLSTSTHDNKRSEDVRTRISLLSEIPDRWSEVLHQWSNLNAPAWQNRVPDRHAEYLVYQTLIGAWPISRERCWEYMLKACREAKINTSWHEPNKSYEEKIRGFVDGLYESRDFIDSLEKFIQPLVQPGRINSLAQTLVKMVAPGVPDFYQGTELWDLSLVDPDNRRPVDFELRAKLLEQSRHMHAAQVLSEWDSGVPKLWVTEKILRLRRERADVFAVESKYQPLVAQGSHLGKLLAFRRGENLIAVVPRLTLNLSGEWGDTKLPLPGGLWRNVFTDDTVQREVLPAELFAGFPIALLIREGA